MSSIKNARFDTEGVYVGRGSKWGNPFRISKTLNRSNAIREYETYLMGRDDLLDALPELVGQDLVCWCVPKQCHAEVLLRLASELESIEGN